MSALWIIVLCLVALVWALSVADIVRQRYSAWTTARDTLMRHRIGYFAP